MSQSAALAEGIRPPAPGGSQGSPPAPSAPYFQGGGDTATTSTSAAGARYAVDEVSVPFLVRESAAAGVDPEEVVLEFKRGWEAEKVLARARQEKIAAASQRLQHARIEGLGRCRMRIDMAAFMDWTVKNKSHHCWSDKAWLDEFERDNPSVRVPQTGGKTVMTVERKLKPQQPTHALTTNTNQGVPAGGVR